MVSGVVARRCKSLLDAGSCGIGTRPRRRAVARRRARLAVNLRTVEELASVSQFNGGEIASDLHVGTALRATPSGCVSGRVRASLWRFGRGGEELPGSRQVSRPAAIGQKTILANTDETTWQDVLGEAPQEFRRA